MKLKPIDGIFGVAKLPSDARIPDWADREGFCAIVRSDDELTIVCAQDRIPADIPSECDWACFRSIGPFAFDEAGIVAGLVTPISAVGIGVFVVCTFDGEHILVPRTRFVKVREILTDAGYQFVDD